MRCDKPDIFCGRLVWIDGDWWYVYETRVGHTEFVVRIRLRDRYGEMERIREHLRPRNVRPAPAAPQDRRTGDVHENEGCEDRATRERHVDAVEKLAQAHGGKPHMTVGEWTPPALERGKELGVERSSAPGGNRGRDTRESWSPPAGDASARTQPTGSEESPRPRSSGAGATDSAAQKGAAEPNDEPPAQQESEPADGDSDQPPATGSDSLGSHADA